MKERQVHKESKKRKEMAYHLFSEYVWRGQQVRKGMNRENIQGKGRKTETVRK